MDLQSKVFVATLGVIVLGVAVAMNVYMLQNSEWLSGYDQNYYTGKRPIEYAADAGFYGTFSISIIMTGILLYSVLTGFKTTGYKLLAVFLILGAMASDAYFFVFVGGNSNMPKTPDMKPIPVGPGPIMPPGGGGASGPLPVEPSGPIPTPTAMTVPVYQYVVNGIVYIIRNFYLLDIIFNNYAPILGGRRR